MTWAASSCWQTCTHACSLTHSCPTAGVLECPDLRTSAIQTGGRQSVREAGPEHWQRLQGRIRSGVRARALRSACHAQTLANLKRPSSGRTGRRSPHWAGGSFVASSVTSGWAKEEERPGHFKGASDAAQSFRYRHRLQPEDCLSLIDVTSLGSYLGCGGQSYAAK